MRKYEITYYTKDSNVSFVVKAPNVLFAQDVVSKVMSKNDKYVMASIYMKKGVWNKTPKSNWNYLSFEYRGVD